MGQVELYSSENGEEEITADLSAGYDVIYEELKGEYSSEEELRSDLCRVVESTILREVEAQSQGSEIHKVIANLIFDLQDTGEIDLDSVVQNSIHQLAQSSE
jgi:hypothetical protein